MNDLITNVENTDKIVMHLVGRNKEQLKSITPSIGDNLRLSIKQIVLKNLKDYRSYSFEEYNLIGSSDDTVEKVEKEAYKSNIQEVMDSIKQPSKGIEITSEDFDFFVYEFILDSENHDDNIFVFRRVKKLKFLKKDS